jgi:hypothetical protein
VVNQLGRPKLDNPRDEVLKFRLTQRELDLLTEAAADAGVPVSAFVRDAALQRAKRRRARALDRSRARDAHERPSVQPPSEAQDAPVGAPPPSV